MAKEKTLSKAVLIFKHRERTLLSQLLIIFHLEKILTQTMSCSAKQAHFFLAGAKS